MSQNGDKWVSLSAARGQVITACSARLMPVEPAGFVCQRGALGHRGAHPWCPGSRAQQPRSPGTASWEDPRGGVGPWADGRAGAYSPQPRSAQCMRCAARPGGCSVLAACQRICQHTTDLSTPTSTLGSGRGDTDRAVDQELRPTEGHSRALAQQHEEADRSAHNPKDAGSNPAPATKGPGQGPAARTGSTPCQRFVSGRMTRR